MNQINQEQITTFLNGRDAQEGIITVECNNSENVAYVIYRRPNGEKRMKKEPYYPFLWLTKQAYNKLYKGDTSERDKTFREKGLTVRNLNIHDSNGKTNKRMVEGYNILVQAKSPMCFNTFQNIFKYAGVDIYERNSGVMRVTPVEQFLIQTGKRMFKGYEDYDNLVRLSFDLETDGLDPKTSKINQIGVRSNKGFEHIIRIDGENKEELRDSEVSAISQYWKIIKELKPDVICGYNSENFDHPFMFTRLEVNDTDIREVTRELYETPYKKKNPTILKLGGEMEYFRQTVIWGHNVTDALHAVRRAQAIDSNMKKADLKYITKYSKLNKSNRVYIPGDKINVLWHDTSNTYAFNDQNGDWYKIDDNHPLKEGYEGVIGEYIVERYLLDDLYETDKVELTYNQSNFLLGKMLPTTFGRVCTMGTAGTWKLILLAWSYEQGIGIPALDRKQDFVGGLSRLLKVGYVDRVVKLDYNSLYPSIILSYDIVSEIDITGVMNTLLEYMLTKREEYKDAKGAAGKKADKISDELKKEGLTDEQVAKLKEQLQTFKAEQNSFDKKQLPFKIFCNSFFGGFGAPYLFPWGDTLCAEATTCIGRQALRLMIQWFSNKGYTPIVGDSFLYDTPMYVKYNKTDIIDIMPISDIFDSSKMQIDGLGREYDYSEKDFKVLCRSGWLEPKYIYRHKTDKKIRRIKTKTCLVDVTEDHSLFDENGNKLHPKDAHIGTKIELYKNEIGFSNQNIELPNGWKLNEKTAWFMGFFLADGSSVYEFRHNKYFSKRDQTIHYNAGKRGCFTINKLNYNKLERANEILMNEFGVKAKIKDYVESSGVYKIKTENAMISKFFSEHFYTKERYNKKNTREKKVPYFILNSSNEIKKAFLDGFYYGDGDKEVNDISEATYFCQKSKVCIAGILSLCNSIGINYTVANELKRLHSVNIKLNEEKQTSKTKTNEYYKSLKNNEISYNEEHVNYDIESYVYDISLDGSVVQAIGNQLVTQTDGFNFQMPSEEELEKREYVGKGLNRNTVEGKIYKKVDADVAEFNDLFMRGKMGLGLDEYAEATINFARKNYADLLVNKKTGALEIKLVGNTIKSKRMAVYIEKFMDEGINLLLRGKGKEFIDKYYEYIDKIYSCKIPLREIASKGKIKKSLEEYKQDCKTKTKSGSFKARQAWYELAIKHELDVNLGDTLYYVNIGKAKSHADIKCIREKNEDGTSKEECEINFNCLLIDNETIESESDTFGEYNRAKYIDQFNKRIKPLIVCFSKEIRDKIIIDSPEKRNSFTDKECELSSGDPIKEEQQDTYTQLMTLDDKEINFWLRYSKKPQFHEEIGLDFDKMVEDYNERLKMLEIDEIKTELNKYKTIINSLTNDDIDDIINEGKLPKNITDFLTINSETKEFISKKYGCRIGSIFDMVEKNEFDEVEDTTE